MFQQSLHRGARKRRENRKLETYLQKIVKENFPNLVKEMDMQVQEAQRVPNKRDANRPSPRHIMIKMPQIKDKEMGGVVG